MKIVKKKEGKIQNAYCLGTEHPVLEDLLRKGSIKKEEGNRWKIFSREATDGEVVYDGDFIKIDSSGIPYPNDRNFFLENHRFVGGDSYEQIPKPLKAWDLEEGMCPEIQFLMQHKGLCIQEEDPKKFFSAPLWGDVLFAGRDAMIVFYEIQYHSDGTLKDVDFNFVARDEFEKTYDIMV